MKKLVSASLALVALLPAPVFAQAAAAQSSGAVKPDALAPSEIVAAAPASDWAAIAASDLLVMDLAPDAKGRARRVIIQLMPPPFSQGWIGNIRKLAAAHWYDGTSINRVQDNYVVQWGDANADDGAKISDKEFEEIVSQRVEAYRKAHPRARPKEIDLAARGFRQAVMNEQIVKVTSSKAKPLPTGLESVSEYDYRSNENYPAAKAVNGAHSKARGGDAPTIDRDPYAEEGFFFAGWPIAWQSTHLNGDVWPVHCYGMVGVGRDLSPNTGTAAELYTVIGHAPRHLDRNIALVGRVIEGIEHLSALPRGTEALGFYKTAEERVPIKAIRMATELATNDIPRFEYLSTESASFARYADARANRRDPFFIRPAGGADICNIPVPVRRAK